MAVREAAVIAQRRVVVPGKQITYVRPCTTELIPSVIRIKQLLETLDCTTWGDIQWGVVEGGAGG